MSWKVRYVDYPKQFRLMENEIMDVIRSTLANGDLILRKQTEDFECHLAAFAGVKHAIGVSNCTDGLIMALLAAGIGMGDEVITVSHTFVATAEAIHFVGATPVLIDIDDDHCMAVEQIAPALTGRTKAIIPVNVNGRMCRMDRILAIAAAHNLKVIEDSAQALGASFQGRNAGAWGLAACFSFYPAKLLGCFGDGGAVLTNDDAVNDHVRWLRNHGRSEKHAMAGWAFNHRLDNLQAAVLDLKLKQLPSWIERRRAIARLYAHELAKVQQVRLPPAPADQGEYYDVFQNYEIEAHDLDGLVKHLNAQGIEVMKPWGGRGVHQITTLPLTHFRLPRTEELFRGALMLPMFPELEDEEVRYVARAVRDYYR